MLILALDCSTARGSIAFARGEERENDRAGVNDARMLWEKEFPAGRGHGGELFSTLQDGWEAVAGGKAAPVLERIVVGLGPGSYSGVRQAIALVTGFGLARGAIVTGLSSTLALETDAPAYHAIGDARRGAFYYTAVAGGRVMAGPELLEGPAELLARFAAHPQWPILAMESVPPTLPAGVEAAAAFPQAARLLVADPTLQQSGILEPIYLRPVSVTMPKARV